MNRSFRRIVTHRRAKLQVRNPRLAPVIDLFESDEKMTYLIGWPGYRNARNRSGLGYVETQDELAYMQGSMISWLFTGKFHRARNFAAILGAIIPGVLLAGIPLALILSELFLAHDLMAFAPLLIGIPNLALGIALLMSALASIFGWIGETISGG